MKIKAYVKIISIILLVAICLGCVSDRKAIPDFKSSVRHHLDAVENRDLETFTKTLTKTNDLNVIFPGGGILENTQAVIDFHRDWFKDKEWVFKTKIVKVIEGTTQSTALVKYDFQDNIDSAPRQAWLVLTFQLEDNSWRLIHDQNTRIDQEK